MFEVQLLLPPTVSAKNFALVDAIVCIVVQAEIGLEVSVLQLLGVAAVGEP